MRELNLYEFYLLRRNETGNLASADDTVFCATGSMNQHAAFVDDLAEALTAQGLDVVNYYTESGPGQQEMNIHYTEALKVADDQPDCGWLKAGQEVPQRPRFSKGPGCHI